LVYLINARYSTVFVSILFTILDTFIIISYNGIEEE
jgi:hypothetical protein